MGFFEKYDSLIRKPEGRPVGVRNGMGQQPQQFFNPALAGMAQTPTPMAPPSKPMQKQQGQNAFTFYDWAKLVGGK